MSTPFTIDLTINLPEGSRLAKQLLNIYFADMALDINKSASILCQADAAIQAQKFAELTLNWADVWSSQRGRAEGVCAVQRLGRRPGIRRESDGRVYGRLLRLPEESGGRVFRTQRKQSGHPAPAHGSD